MKIMMFATESVIHGQRYIRLLQLAGCKVVLVEHEQIQHNFKPNVTYRRYPRRGIEAIRKFFGYRLADILIDGLLRRLWVSERPNICHVQWVDSRAWHCGRAGLRPLVLTVWGSDLNWANMPGADPNMRKIVSEALVSADLVIVDSEDLIETAMQLAGRTVKALVLPIGIDTQMFRPGLSDEAIIWRNKLQIPKEALVILSARALGENYRQDVILRAFAELDMATGDQIYLVIRSYGQKGNQYRKFLDNLAAQLGVEKKIRWVEEIEYPTLPSLYAACDFAINFPSIDAFPVTFLECLASGLPVITNRLPAYKSNGIEPHLIFVDGNETENLRTVLENVLKLAPDFKLKALKSREYIVSTCDERITAMSLREAYRKLCA